MLKNPNLTRRECWIWIAGLVVLNVLYWTRIVRAQEVQKPNYGPQVVLYVIRSETGHVHVIPKATVSFTLIPLHPENSPAPLPDKTNMLCHQYDIRDQNGALHIAFKCGADEYILQGIGIAEK